MVFFIRPSVPSFTEWVVQGHAGLVRLRAAAIPGVFLPVVSLLRAAVLPIPAGIGNPGCFRRHGGNSGVSNAAQSPFAVLVFDFSRSALCPLHFWNASLLDPLPAKSSNRRLDRRALSFRPGPWL